MWHFSIRSVQIKHNADHQYFELLNLTHESRPYVREEKENITHHDMRFEKEVSPGNSGITSNPGQMESFP